MEDRIKELLELISNDDKYDNCVFWGQGIYFVIGNGNLWEISDDASSSPKGGWFPDIVTGPTIEENDCLQFLMDELEFDEEFFNDFFEDYDEFEDDDMMEFFEDNDDDESLKIYRKLKRKVNSGKTPFATIESLISAVRRYGLENDRLYYDWEGEYIDFHDNIADFGEGRGTYDGMSDEEWVNLLENIDDHIVNSD